MPPTPNGAQAPPRGVARALDIAIAHEQVLLSSIAGFDGKLMFLTALNVAGLSALVGIAVSAEPWLWLFGLSMAACAVCALSGLANLWTGDIDQFPTPDEAIRAADENTQGPDALAWRYLTAVQKVSQDAQGVLRRKLVLMRTLLATTPISLGLVVATALTATL